MWVTKHDFALYKINVLISQNFIVGDEISIWHWYAWKSERGMAHARTLCRETGNTIQIHSYTFCHSMGNFSFRAFVMIICSSAYQSSVDFSMMFLQFFSHSFTFSPPLITLILCSILWLPFDLYELIFYLFYFLWHRTMV